MAERTLKIAVLLEAQRSRMTARQAQFPLLATFALIGLTAVAIFAPLASATSSKRSAATEATAASQDEARHQALSTLVANHDAAARKAIDASRELTHAVSAKPASATVAGGELLRTAKDSARPATRTMRMLVTAYCPCKKCCGASAQGITASGKTVSYNQGRFVAADKSVLKFGTKLMIPGYHNESPVEVIDTGSAIKGNRLDVYYPDHQMALEWGKRWVDVVVVE